MKNASDKICKKKNQNTYFMINNFFLNFFVNEIMWRNTVQPDRTHDTMAHAHCMLDT